MQPKIREKKQPQFEIEELKTQQKVKLEMNSSVDSQYEEQERQIEDTEQENDKEWIKDAHQYLEYCINNKKIKVMDEQNPIFSNVYLKDISLHYKGPMEDKVYSNNYKYYINIRRGNTLCQIYHDNHNFIIGQKKQSKSTQSGQSNKLKEDNFNSSNNTELPNVNDSSKNNNGYELFFCRRGMKKFYDLQPQYLSTQHQQKLTIQHKKYRRRIFQSIDAINYQHSQIHLYSIFKENGEHCQITYIKQLDTWLFASKNVSILVRDQNDVEKHYEKIRFYWAKLIAKQFLYMLKSLSKQQISELKQELNTKTLLGEHCGHQNHQHITRYDCVQIIFYAIVQKNTQDHCLPVQYCRNFLQKYNFKMSKIKSITNLKDKNSTYQAIYKLLKLTAEGTMEQYGQGSVLYVVEERGKTQRTISMCKLKTSEYLIFRRLREMLKLNVERKSTANTFEKFKFDIQNLISHYFSPPQPLQSYLNLAKQAFKQASQNTNINENYLRYKFVEFIQKISANKESQREVEFFNKKVLVICLPRFTNTLEKYAKNNSIPIQYMYRNLPVNNKEKQKKVGSLHILHMIPRLPESLQGLQNLEIFVCEYSAVQIEQIQKSIRNCKDLTRSHLITFVKSQDKRKSLQLLNQKIQFFKQTLKSKNIRFTLISQQVKDKDQQIISQLEEMRKLKEQLPQMIEVLSEEKQKHSSSNNKHFIIYPMLLPGSGKSTLRQQLEKLSILNGFEFASVSGDQIRSKLMQQNLNLKGVDFDLESQYFNQTFAEVKEKANQQLRSVLKQNIQHHLKVQRDTILFVDKIYGAESIQVEIEFVSKYNNIIPIVLIAQSNEVKLKCFTLPFSLQYMLICLKRCIEREEHSTMTRRPEQICNIFVWFLKMYGNLSPRKVQQTLQKMNSHTQLLRVQTISQRQFGVHMILRKKLQQCIYSNRSSEKSIQLIQQMYKNMDGYLKDSYVQERKDNAARQIIQRLRQKLIQN